MICAGADWGLCSLWPGPVAAVGAVAIIMASGYTLFRAWGFDPVESGVAASGLVIVVGILLATGQVLTQGHGP